MEDALEAVAGGSARALAVVGEPGIGKTRLLSELGALAERRGQLVLSGRDLGNVQEQLGEFEAARGTQQRALAIFEAVYGPEHPEVAITLGNLGNVQQRLGEFEAARGTQQRALAINEAVYGPEHPSVAITLTNLGIVQQQLGELEAARTCMARALAIFERSLGPEHPTTRQARGHLSSMTAGAPTGSDERSAPATSSRRWSRLRRGPKRRRCSGSRPAVGS